MSYFKHDCYSMLCRRVAFNIEIYKLNLATDIKQPIGYIQEDKIQQ